MTEPDRCDVCEHDRDDHRWTYLDEGPWASESYGCTVEGCACGGFQKVMLA